MATATWLLADLGDGRWVLKRGAAAPQELNPTSDSRELAAQLGIAASGEAPEIVVGIASGKCLAATIDWDGKQRDRQTLLFALEERLPQPAESLTADFLFDRAEGRALGIATDHAYLETLRAALAEMGAEVVAICPLATLALAGLKSGTHTGTQVILARSPAHIDLLTLEAGQLREWRVLPATPEAIERAGILLAHSGQAPDETRAYQVPSAWIQRWNLGPIRLADETWIDLASVAAVEIAARRSTPLITWSSERAGAGSLSTSLPESPRTWWIAIAILVLLAVAFFWRAQRYQARKQEFTSAQQTLFQELFPGQPVPVGVRSRLQSEVAKASEQTETPPSGSRSSALPHLQAILTALSTDIPGRWDMIQVDAPHTFQVEGMVESAATVERLRAQLNDAGYACQVSQSPRPESSAVAVSADGDLPDG